MCNKKYITLILHINYTFFFLYIQFLLIFFVDLKICKIQFHSHWETHIFGWEIFLISWLLARNFILDTWHRRFGYICFLYNIMFLQVFLNFHWCCISCALLIIYVVKLTRYTFLYTLPTVRGVSTQECHWP